MQPIFTPKEKKAIFFDLHDTLVDRDKSFFDALTASLSEFTARWLDDWDSAASIERYAREWTRRSASPRSGARTVRSASYDQNQIDCLRKALRNSPLPLSDSFLRSVLKRAKELTPTYPQLFPDVQETLSRLKEQYNVAIISNGSQQRLTQTLERSGLTQLFEPSHIFVPTSRKRKKPHPEMFNKAMHALGVSPAESVMVGNSWKNDVFGANRCGMDVIWIRNTNTKTVHRKIGKNKVIFVSRCKQLLGLFD